MSTIKVKCVKHSISLLETPEITSGSDNVDAVEFEFCPAWDGYSKVAVFYQQKGEIYYSLIDDNQQAVIPKDVLNKSGVINMGVFGVNGDKTKTSAILRYRVDNGAINGFEIADPDPDLYEQILNDYGEIKNIFNQMKQEQSDFITDAGATVEDAKDLMHHMYDALQAIQFDYLDLDGGDPFIQLTEDDNDCNGGYPVDMTLKSEEVVN